MEMILGLKVTMDQVKVKAKKLCLGIFADFWPVL